VCEGMGVWTCGCAGVWAVQRSAFDKDEALRCTNRTKARTLARERSDYEQKDALDSAERLRHPPGRRVLHFQTVRIVL
jgi:hypothetical protein